MRLEQLRCCARRDAMVTSADNGLAQPRWFTRPDATATAWGFTAAASKRGERVWHSQGGAHVKTQRPRLEVHSNLRQARIMGWHSHGGSHVQTQRPQQPGGSQLPQASVDNGLAQPGWFTHQDAAATAWRFTYSKLPQASVDNGLAQPGWFTRPRVVHTSRCSGHRPRRLFTCK
jgi:hypothetical protein